MKRQSIKAHFNFFTLVIVAALTVITLSVLGGWIVNLKRYNQVMAQYYSFNTLSKEISQAYVDLNSHIQNPSPELQIKYSQSMTNALETVTNIMENAGDADIYYAMVGIKNMIAEANTVNGEIMDRLDLDSFNDIYESHMESQTLFNYINLRLSSVNKLQSEFMQVQLSERTKYIYLTVAALAALSLCMIFLVTAFGLNFSRKISEPLRQISQQANELASGNLEADDIPPQSLTEFSSIAASLNKMKARLSQMIIKIREQSDIAVKLQKSELENLRISNDLKNTELRVMQAQINPHFLFNTLNSISRLALQAKDMEVVDLIEALSQMLRYNLNHINRAITLREEIENMKNYIHIQEIRFKDKLGFIIENHSDRMELQMPCMTLQPIVENAIVHGLKPYNYEGAVTVTITDQEEYTLVSIQDDGIGMEKQDIRRMILGKPEQGEHTSIGFQNVMARLNTFFGREDCVNAVSELGGGTEITLKLYCKRSTPHV